MDFRSQHGDSIFGEYRDIHGIVYPLFVTRTSSFAFTDSQMQVAHDRARRLFDKPAAHPNQSSDVIFECPNCGHSHIIDRAAIGKAINCVGCKVLVIVPEPVVTA